MKQFFNECNDMRDWLIGDVQALPKSASKNQIGRHFYGEQSLKLCNGVANTSKHHTRKPTDSEPDPITAQIHETTLTGGKNSRVTIRYSSPSMSDEKVVDARKLAHECVEAWRAFFKKHGIDEPKC